MRPDVVASRLTDRALRIRRIVELMSLLDALPWFAHVVHIASKVDPPEWWIGAGVIRDIVWGERFARGFDPAMTKDIDLAFFDPTNLDPERDRMVEAELGSHDVGLPWDAKNQAAVHLWYPKRFGLTVDPLASAEDAVATFPEFVTCVAVRRLSNGTWDVTAPYGLNDLLDGVWRRNPQRVTEQEYQSRLERKQPQRLWPAVRIAR